MVLNGCWSSSYHVCVPGSRNGKKIGLHCASLPSHKSGLISSYRAEKQGTEVFELGTVPGALAAGEESIGYSEPPTWQPLPLRILLWCFFFPFSSYSKRTTIAIYWALTPWHLFVWVLPPAKIAWTSAPTSFALFILEHEVKPWSGSI